MDSSLAPLYNLDEGGKFNEEEYPFPVTYLDSHNL